MDKLDQCFISSKVSCGIHPWAILQDVFMYLIRNISSDITVFKLLPQSSRGQWVNSLITCLMLTWDISLYTHSSDCNKVHATNQMIFMNFYTLNILLNPSSTVRLLALSCRKQSQYYKIASEVVYNIQRKVVLQKAFDVTLNDNASNLPWKINVWHISQRIHTTQSLWLRHTQR